MSDQPGRTTQQKAASGAALHVTVDKGSIVGQLPRTLGKLRLRDLETLDLLGRTRSFARTAEAAAITQPALSKWLRELEQAIGLPLRTHDPPRRAHRLWRRGARMHRAHAD